MFRFLVLLTVWGGCAAVANAQVHNVLLIHSYHEGMPWTDAQHRGFVDTLRAGGQHVDLHVEHLDTLRHRHQKAAMQENLRRMLLGKFKDYPPKIIVVTDNDALDFALILREELAPGAPVVFCGVNGLDPNMRDRHKNLTGVAEEASFKETLEVMETLLPGRRVLVLGEQSSTFKGNFGSLKEGNAKRAQPAELEVFDDPVLSRIEERVRKAGPDTAVFILLRPVNDYGETIDSAVAVRAISNASRQPVFSAWDYMFGYGIVGGKLTSGEAHGEIAAKQAIRILNGEAADSIPFEWESANRYLFDYEQLLRFGLQDKPLPEGSTVINRPESFYEHHREKVIAVAVAFALLALLGVWLLLLNRSLRESRNLLNNIIDNIPVMIFLKRASDLSFVLFNRSGEKLTGLNREKVLGRHTNDFFPKEQADFFNSKDLEALGQKEVVDIPQEPIETLNGTRILHTQKLALRNEAGQSVYLLGVSEDITERKRAEESLQRYRDDLEETVQTRTAELRQARDAAEAANKAKSLFLSNMSHELRTPLNAILGFSHMMRREGGLSEAQYRNLDIINRSGEHLLTLINDVLEIAKIESGRIELEIAPFDLDAMARDVVELMRLRAMQKGLELIFDKSSEFPRYIRGDEARLRQILVNLVGNAVKFTEKGRITVRLGIKNNARQHLLIEVRDTGPGISKADQKRLFQPFVQLSEGVSKGGTGLGLSIVRHFVEMMNGTVRVESEPGKGSLFLVELLLDAVGPAESVHPGEPAHGDAIATAPDQPKYRALIAEDQEENRILMLQLMEVIGIETRAVENGKECVAAFDEWRPDIIWMDRLMPVMDGLEATKQIRKLPGGDKVKIVAVTASVFKEQRKELLEAGMDDYVAKPYHLNDICDCLTRQLGMRFVYHSDEAAKESDRQALATEKLAALPEVLRAELKEALESLDGERIAKMIGKINVFDEQLGKTLSAHAAAFNYSPVLTALQATAKGERS